MKSTINTLSCLSFFLLIKCEASGQPLFSFEPDNYYISAVPEIFENEFGEFTAEGSFESTVDDTLYLKWQIIVPQECPNEWEFYIADTQLSWLTSVSTNIDSAAMLNFPMPLPPSPVFNNFVLHLYPHSVVGCCTVEVRFSLAEEPDSIIEVAIYDIDMLDASCFASSNQAAAAQEQVQVYPNPAHSAFQLLNDEDVKAASMYNLTGNLLSTLDYLLQQRVETASLPPGIYLLKLELRDGKTNWQRVVVQH